MTAVEQLDPASPVPDRQPHTLGPGCISPRVRCQGAICLCSRRRFPSLSLTHFLSRVRVGPCAGASGRSSLHGLPSDLLPSRGWQAKRRTQVTPSCSPIPVLFLRQTVVSTRHLPESLVRGFGGVFLTRTAASGLPVEDVTGKTSVHLTPLFPSSLQNS